ncbi:MAG: SUMF1/EgtB/PvdO family nonheme iron enzyme, partial [Acidobacteria bacterium]|nr:SUMF1/EgtB/PvdO family nonheme iron enzyme [Acidobacteriota bacterium]
MKPVLILLLTSTAFAGEMVRIPAGHFEVTDAITTLKVRVAVSEFLLGATEVTQSEYQQITGANPSVYKGPERPVENVSWWDAIRYANLLSAKEALTPCYELSTGRRRPACTGYRLPTDAEWSLAAGAKPPAGEMAKLANLGRPETTSLAIFAPALERGTLPVKSLAPGARGLYDVWGNVWEWCEDWDDPVRSPDSVEDPQGPLQGLMRVIHGGSFLTTTGEWSRDYRSSMKPGDRSRYTGIRLARGLPGNGERREVEQAGWFARFNQAPAGFESSIGPLSPLLASGGIEAWNKHSVELQSKWTKLLNPPRFPTGPVTSRLLKEVYPRNFAGKIYELETEPGIWEKVCVLRPRNPLAKPLPVVIVPYYDIDVPVGADFGGRSFP